jgi:hypothetical protein
LAQLAGIEGLPEIAGTTKRLLKKPQTCLLGGDTALSSSGSALNKVLGKPNQLRELGSGPETSATEHIWGK